MQILLFVEGLYGVYWQLDNWQMAKNLLTTDKNPKILVTTDICSKIYW